MKIAQLTNPALDGTSLESDYKAAVSGSSFGDYFVNLWSAMLAVGALAVLILFVWGALEWILSGGDKGKIENARNRITNALIGLIILVGSYAILGFVGQLFFGEGFEILNVTVPNLL